MTDWTARLWALRKKFGASEGGNVAMIFGMMLIPVLAVTGGAVDYGRAVAAKSKLQGIVDAAANAGARLPATANQNREKAVLSVFDANVAGTELADVKPQVNATNADTSVQATYTLETSLLGLIGIEEIDVTAKTTSRSQIENGGVVCLLALNPDTPDGLHLQGINKTSQRNCWAWVNSTSATSINAVGASAGTAQGFCTAGGVVGAEHFTPAPYKGCDAFEDPFAEKFASLSPATSCTKTNTQLKSGTHTIEPGTYCGGLSLKPQADVTFKPGLYVIKDGTFEVQAGATATGEGVTFYFIGSGTKFEVRGGAGVNFKAPAENATAGVPGFLFVQHKSASPGAEMIIQGGGSIKMEGVLYAPTWRVNISGNGEVNQDSKFWAMVADSFYMEGNGKLYINSDAPAVGLPDIMPKIPTGPLILE
jgi:Flp pilus assembly protein TadG